MQPSLTSDNLTVRPKKKPKQFSPLPWLSIWNSSTNGIPATVNRQSWSRSGSVCSEVWIHDDSDGDRANTLVRTFLAEQSAAYVYPASRGIAIVLRIGGVGLMILAVLQLLGGASAGDRVATALTFAAIGAFLVVQGNRESRLAKHSVPRSL
jgi:hypothetical protein